MVHLHESKHNGIADTYRVASKNTFIRRCGNIFAFHGISIESNGHGSAHYF
ncbi:hypothetical protein [Aquimarina hainanensis]|uniref:hypothetical protein n=1 Tax=Aquimarina hainanensis TaxID=1578017 RepID=UPI0036206536